MGSSAKLSDLLPSLFSKKPPMIDGSSPLIVNGNLLYLQEVQMLPLTGNVPPRLNEANQIKMYAALAGYSVLRNILETDPKDYPKLIWRKSSEMPVWIGSVDYDNFLDDLLRVFDTTKFGDVIVLNDGEIALATLAHIVQLYRLGKLKSSLRASEVGSDRISVPKDTSLRELMSLMFEKSIRCVFVEGETNSGEDYYFVSGRHIIRFLFDPARLELAKDKPDLWVEAKAGQIKLGQARIIKDSKTINQASIMLGNAVDDCLVCEESKKVLSRWDLVMKPWKAKATTFGEN